MRACAYVAGDVVSDEAIPVKELRGRVDKIERVQERFGVRLEHVERTVDKVAVGVDKLLERDARRPDALTWRAIAAVCGGAVTIALVGQWLIAHAPAVQDLERRVEKLDDADVGRVTRIERHIEASTPGWNAAVVRRAR